MSIYYVSLDRDGEYERKMVATDAKSAAEDWAEWYCHHSAEFSSPFECFVRAPDGEPEAFEITIESAPVFHASRA